MEDRPIVVLTAIMGRRKRALQVQFYSSNPGMPDVEFSFKGSVHILILLRQRLNHNWWCLQLQSMPANIELREPGNTESNLLFRRRHKFAVGEMEARGGGEGAGHCSCSRPSALWEELSILRVRVHFSQSECERRRWLVGEGWENSCKFGDSCVLTLLRDFGGCWQNKMAPKRQFKFYHT